MIEAKRIVELRKFGIVMACGVAFVFGGLLPFLFGYDYPSWPWIVSAVFVTVAWLMPKLLMPVERVWLQVGEVLGFINSRIILGLVFYIVLMPMGLIKRLFHPDPLNLRFQNDLTSYRISRQDVDFRMEKPF